MKKYMHAVACVFTALCLLTACQPTPEVPVVVGKDEETLKAAMAQAEAAAETAKPYDAPEHIKLDINDLPNNFSIIFDADVEVSGQTDWPVYTIEKAAVTQEQADAVRKALLKDTVLYKPGEYRSREEIQRSIDSYEEELRISSEKGYAELVESYRGFLKDLYAEYENTPQDLKLEEADTRFAFMEDRLQPKHFGGKKTETEDGGFRYEWTDEARANAKAAGCEDIYGVCWLDSRKMEFSAKNGDRYSGISFTTADGNLMQEGGVSYTLEEAKEKADALLNKMNAEFSLVESFAVPLEAINESGDVVEKGDSYYHLVYKRNIDGVPQDNILPSMAQYINGDYRGPVMQQETITIEMDDTGILLFSWSSPMKIMKKESEHAALMPFDEVTSRIVQQLKVQKMWDASIEGETEYIDSRRLQISKIKLSYILIEKENDLDSYYLMPVWNVCGDMFYHYVEDYPTGEHDTYILDENFERNAWRERNDTRDYAILTLNALDGSVITRYPG